MNRKIFLLISYFVLLLPALYVDADTGGLSVNGTTATNSLTISGLNCTANANGGALTANASGVVSCSDDDNTPAVPLTLNGSFSGSIISAANSGSGYGVLGLRGSFELGNRGYLGHSDYGVYGDGAIGVATGVYGRNLLSGNFGYLGGSAHGVHGESGSGVGGYFTSATGYGLIVNSGNVGIGTLSPNEKLRVEGNIFVNGTEGFDANGEDATVQFGHPAHNIRGEHGTGVVISAFSAHDALTVREISGNVGIGTTNPSQKLTVAGTIESTSGGIKFPDGSVQTTSASYGGVAVVAKSGGDYANPVTAMNNVDSGDSWCGTPSATNTCMLKIMPGIYDLGNNGLAMRAYVDIEGSGENVTTITSTHSSASFDAASATVSSAVNNAEIRNLTVDNRGGSFISIAIYNSAFGLNPSHPDIKNVTATASGGSFTYGVYNDYSAPVMTNVTATASGGAEENYGVYNYLAYESSVMTNVTAIASGGITSYGVYNKASSPTMTNVTAIASGGIASYGVYNYSFSSPRMTIVTAEASGGTDNNYGVYNTHQSSPRMMNVRAYAWGSLEATNINYGVLNTYSSSPTMRNATAYASGGVENYGVSNSYTSSMTIQASNIGGTQNSIVNHTYGTVSATSKVGATMLDGPVVGTGFTCVGAYDEAFVALGPACN